MPQLQINQGPQDALLYDNTRSYFTNVGYVRTSNFQMELRDVQPVSNAQFGSRVDYVIPKSADLLGPIDLIVDLNMILILAAFAFIGGCVASLLQCALRSRCTTIKCCGAYIERDVVSDEQVTTLDTGALESAGRT